MLKQTISLTIIIFLAAASLCLADQDTEDVFASVTILPAFDITIDNNYLDFGVVEPGKSVTLKENTYHNEIKCVSNKDIDYYIKIDIIDKILGPKGKKIPPESFKWRIYQVKGDGAPVSSKWQEFSSDPVLVYSSGSDDITGSEVTIKFQYRLDLPADATAGHYSLRVGYMLTEER